MRFAASRNELVGGEYLIGHRYRARFRRAIMRVKPNLTLLPILLPGFKTFAVSRLALRPR